MGGQRKDGGEVRRGRKEDTGRTNGRIYIQYVGEMGRRGRVRMKETAGGEGGMSGRLQVRAWSWNK